MAAQVDRTSITETSHERHQVSRAKDYIRETTPDNDQLLEEDYTDEELEGMMIRGSDHTEYANQFLDDETMLRLANIIPTL